MAGTGREREKWAWARKLLEDSKQGMDLEIGAILEGKVTGITKFGAFVSLPGGRSGLVHISEVAYSYVSEVSEFLTVGQEVKVKVISVDENGRINLSIKQTLPPPPKPERNGGRGGDRGGNRRFDNNRGSKEGRSEERGASRPEGRYNNDRGSRPANPRPAPAPRSNTPKEPASFDDMLKQFMSESESRQAQANRGERTRRRPRRGGSNN